MVAITIIMPVYNDELYLNQAIDSVLKQTLKDIELICINDGSTDNSLNILEEYSQEHDFIKIINQENQGAAVARNTAMKQAKGEYIGFLDSDDYYMNRNALKKLYDIACKNDADMVSANIKSLNNKGKVVTNYNLKEFREEKVISPEDYGIPYTFGKNIYKTSFMHENNFLFPDYIRGEDPVFLARILTTVKEIYTVPINYMCIRSHKYNGLYKIDTYEKKEGYLQHFHDTFKILDEANFNKMLKRYEKYLFYFIDFKRNFADKKLYNIFNDVFKDEPHILEESKNHFTFNNPKFSVIIPINDEEYLENAIKNLYLQYFTDFEMIFAILDNSSTEIISNSITNDIRVKVINSNEYHWINDSLEKAEGDYIFFYHPQDNIRTNTFSKLDKHIADNKSDLILFRIASFYGNYSDYDYYDFDLKSEFGDIDFDDFTFDYKEIPDKVLNSEFYEWNKCYKKEFLESLNLNEMEENHFNNILLHIKSMLNAPKLSYIHQFFYHHRVNLEKEGYYFLDCMDLFKMFNTVENYLKENDYFAEFSEEFDLFKINQILKYIVPADSEDFYLAAKNELAKINLKNPDSLDKYQSLKVDYILENDSYQDYKVFDLNQQVKQLNHEKNVLNKQQKTYPKEYNKLKKQRKKSKKLNKDLKYSKSWLITSPLRKITSKLK